MTVAANAALSHRPQAEVQRWGAGETDSILSNSTPPHCLFFFFVLRSNWCRLKWHHLRHVVTPCAAPIGRTKNVLYNRFSTHAVRCKQSLTQDFQFMKPHFTTMLTANIFRTILLHSVLFNDKLWSLLLKHSHWTSPDSQEFNIYMATLKLDSSITTLIKSILIGLTETRVDFYFGVVLECVHRGVRVHDRCLLTCLLCQLNKVSLSDVFMDGFCCHRLPK